LVGVIKERFEQHVFWNCEKAYTYYFMAPALLTHIPFKYVGKGKLFSVANWSVSFIVQPIFLFCL